MKSTYLLILVVIAGIGLYVWYNNKKKKNDNKTKYLESDRYQA